MVQNSPDLNNVLLASKSEQYLSICEKFGTIPVTMISRGLNNSEPNLAYHGIGPGGAKFLV
jgi:hypothetical protein